MNIPLIYKIIMQSVTSKEEAILLKNVVFYDIFFVLLKLNVMPHFLKIVRNSYNKGLNRFYFSYWFS